MDAKVDDVGPLRRGGWQDGHKTAWTPELIEQLKGYFWNKKSASQIGELLGFTRNAIIGKLFRLGLRRSPEDLHRARANRKSLTPRVVSFRRAIAAAESSFVPSEDVPPLPPLNIPLVDTTRSQCKFIAGYDGLCCGHPTIGGSWCAHHHARVYVRR